MLELPWALPLEDWPEDRVVDRWFLSERTGKDVGLTETIPSYIEKVLRPAPDEKLPAL